MDIAAALDEYAAVLTEHGLDATADPNELRTPGVWVQGTAYRPTFAGDLLDVDAQLVLVADDNGYRRSLEQLGRLLEQVLPIVEQPRGDITSASYVGPPNVDGVYPAARPALIVPITFQHYPEPETEE